MQRASLPALFSLQKLGLSLGLLLLAGCAQLYPEGGYSGSYNDAYLQSDFDELLEFGANMSKIPPASRAKVCRTLLKRHKQSSGAGIQLHLMVGRLLSDSCGDIPRILRGINAISAAYLSDDRMQRFVALHTEALRRLQHASGKSDATEQREKSAQSETESKELSGSKKNETRLLREKLEAIRAMEKQLDESGDAN